MRERRVLLPSSSAAHHSVQALSSLLLVARPLDAGTNLLWPERNSYWSVAPVCEGVPARASIAYPVTSHHPEELKCDSVQPWEGVHSRKVARAVML